MKPLRLFVGLIAGLFLAGALHAQTAPAAGRDYVELNPARPVATGARIEVIEFFYYGCPICYELQPHMQRWRVEVAEDVALRYVPAVSRDGWEPLARSFFALEAMGHLARLHWPLYDNFHFDGKDLREESVLLEWLARNGVDAQKFREVWYSAETSAKVYAAQQMLDTYNVRGVPTMVVDGKYVTSARMAGGTREMMKVVVGLVERARRERKQ